MNSTPQSFLELCAQMPDHPFEDTRAPYTSAFDLLLDPLPATPSQPVQPTRSARKNASRRERRAEHKRRAGATPWPALDRSPRPEHEELFQHALDRARTVDLAPGIPGGLPELSGLPGPRKAMEGRGGATSVVTTIRLLIRSPFPKVLASVIPDRVGMPGRPGTPPEFWFFFAALARELRSCELAEQEVREHWAAVVVPEFAAQNVTLRPVGNGKHQAKTPGYSGFRHWRANLVRQGLLGPVNVVFTVLSLRLHVALAEALGHRHGDLLDPEWWQVLFSDSTVMRAPSEVFYYCPLCGPCADPCDHPEDLVKGHHSRARTDGAERVAEQGRDYGPDKTHGNKRGGHHIAIGASNGKGTHYRRIVIAVDVDKEDRDEMSVAMPLLAHVLELAGPDWIRGLAYDGLLKGRHHLDLLRRFGVPVINVPSTASGHTADAEHDDVPGTTIRTSGKHKGVRVATHSSQQRIIEHRDAYGHPCVHFVICDDGATYDASRPLTELKARKLSKGKLLTPVAMHRTQLSRGEWEAVLEFEIRCQTYTERFGFVLTDSRVDDAGDVPYSEPIQASRHFCDADTTRLRSIIGVRSNIESLFSWFEQRFMHKDRVASWDRDDQLLDFLGAAIAANAEVWAHAQADFAAARS